NWHLTEVVEHELGRGDPFAAAIRGTRMPMVITNPRLADNPIVFANKAFQNLTGYERDEIVGRNCRFLQGPDTNPGSVLEIRQAISAGEDVQVDILNYRKDGSMFWNALFMSPVRNAAGEIEYFFASQLDVTDRVEAQASVEKQKALVEREVSLRTAALQAALEAKTLLLHEVDHRVKNNLTMIGSLLRLQSKSLGDPVLAATLNSMLERVDALATVHRRLYQSDDISRFDIGPLVETMTRDILGSAGREDIRAEIEVASVLVPSRHASAIGLIVNEAITNAVKHGFANNRSGTLKVSVSSLNGTARIVVADDGPGMATKARSGLGRTLITRLSRQIEGETVWLSAEPGTQVVISFPVGD
ncbi:MAG: PAS domain-containing protein, partial [Zymomonas sp.]